MVKRKKTKVISKKNLLKISSIAHCSMAMSKDLVKIKENVENNLGCFDL